MNKFAAACGIILWMISGMFLCAKEAIPTPSVEAGTLPPAQYVIDYYAPPPDWIPARAICDYILNTRVPDLFWLKYDGAYTLALRVRPMTKQRIEKALESDLIPLERKVDAPVFSADAEKADANRQVVIRDLNVSASDFIEFSFKMKATNSAPVRVIVDGVGLIETDKHEDREVKCFDGFKAYKVTFTPKKDAVLRELRIQLPASESYDSGEEYVFFDLNFKRNAPKARFTDLPRRQWVLKNAFDENRPLTMKDGIGDVCAFVNANPREIESIDLPWKDFELREQKEKDMDGGFKVESVKETLDGKEVDALRITLENGPRCYLKFPVKLDAVKFNTLTFLTKIELPEGLDQRRIYGDTVPMLYGTDAQTVNSFFDTFSFGLYSASHDQMDWNRFGASPGLTAYHRQREAKTPAGWTAVALDVINSDKVGNKSTFYPKVTHWCFYYDNKKIPAGKKVVVTIANPKASSGVMYAGGDIGKYRQFLAEKDRFIMNDFSDGSKYLKAPETNRLPEPLPFIREHTPRAEIILTNRGYAAPYKIIVERALNYFQSFLRDKYGMLEQIPVLDQASDKDNVKIFLGDSHYADVDKAQYDADMKTLKGTPGCAIRAKGKNIYIYGGDFNYSGTARGIANGLYLFLENNTDEIMPYSTIRSWKGYHQNVFESDKSGSMNLVWGNGYLNVPPLKTWSMTGSDIPYLDRNFSAPGVWESGDWKYGGLRNRSTNHWWGFGASVMTPEGKEDWKTPNDKWGLGVDDKRMVPGCYTGHPCLINVMDDAKEAYVNAALQKVADNPQTPKGKSYGYKVYDLMGLWVEDTLKTCQCGKCKTPIRLANGSLLAPDSVEFLSTQFFANACAMINAVNVHAKRDMQVESIAYFWMSAIPMFEVSRNYKIRFCPYIRKDYAVPIYAPANDLFWRDMYRWSQMDIASLGIYEYFLYVNLRPWTSVFQYDLKAEIAIGLQTATPETQQDGFCMLEQWVATRLFWNPDRDPKELRKYYIWRTFCEAAPEMEKFYFTLHNLYFETQAYSQPMEFEDAEQMMVNAFLTKSSSNPGMTVGDELVSYMERAREAVRNPNSRKVLDALYMEWIKYAEAARKSAEFLKK